MTATKGSFGLLNRILARKLEGWTWLFPSEDVDSIGKDYYNSLIMKLDNHQNNEGSWMEAGKARCPHPNY